MFMRMIYDERLAQAAYLIGCQRTGEAIIIDPERDVDRYLDLAAKNDLTIVAAAETHIHADFVSGARELAERVGAKVYVSDEGGPDWRSEWLDQKIGGGSYDAVRLHDGDTFRIGHIEFRVMHTPGHTPEHIVYLIVDHGGGADEPIAVATGDFVFVGDLGRPDLLESAAGQVGAMEPSAHALFHTVKKLDLIPDFVQVWPAHGAGSACGKALGAVPTSTIGYERRFSPALQHANDEDEFVDFILSGQPEPPLYFANMKHVNKVGPAILGELPQPKQGDVAELRALDPSTVKIVDTRPWERFRDGFISGSVSLPLRKTFCADAGSFVRETDDIWLIVAPEQKEDVVRALVRIGLDRIVGWFHPDAVSDYADASHALSTIDEITVDEVAERAAAAGTGLLDVRRSAEFAEGHVEGATNISHTRLMARLDEVPDDETLIVYCRTGQRSARSASYLAGLGRNVVNVKGGMVAWREAGLDVSGEAVTG